MSVCTWGPPWAHLGMHTQIKSERPSVFDFWATWCGPCRVISPIFEQLSEKFTNIKFYKVDVDEAQDVAQEVGVRAVSAFRRLFFTHENVCSWLLLLDY